MLRPLLLRAMAKAAGPPPDDHALRWRGTGEPGEPVLRIAHFGDCSWREMPLSHGVHTPPGYPRAIARRLSAEGIGLEFSSTVAHQFDHLPREGELDVYVKLTGDPDVVLVQLGAMYTRLIVLPDSPELLRLRQRISKSLRRRVFLAYRPLRPVQFRFGRFSTPYAGADELRAFLERAHARWPGARLGVLLPFPRVYAAPHQLAIWERVRADVAAAAEAAGSEVIDANALLPRDAAHLRCANGYNLNADGAALVGDRLADWVLAGLSSRAAA
jgi:hypothetical protein